MRWVHANPNHQPVFRREVSRDIVSYAWIPTKAAVTAMGLAARAADAETLAKVTQPVLLLHGRRDVVTSPVAACGAVEKVSSTVKRTVLLDNTNHILFWDYEREAIAQEVLDFLKKRL
jgi:alpha-beta hydrolase superfamily lysophospholipase